MAERRTRYTSISRPNIRITHGVIAKQVPIPCPKKPAPTLFCESFNGRRRRLARAVEVSHTATRGSTCDVVLPKSVDRTSFHVCHGSDAY